MIGGGISLIGKLFGNKPQKTENRVNYKQMVTDAEAAGFNPLTALRNGGAAGFTTTTQPALSSRAIIGEAMGEVGNFISNFDPMADDRREQEYNLVQAQIANLNASTASMSRSQSFKVPTYTAGQVERRPSGTAAQLSRTMPASAGAPRMPTVETPTVTNPWRNSVIDPNVRDAAAFEERYGDSEIAQIIYGALVGASDARANYPRWPDLSTYQLPNMGTSVPKWLRQGKPPLARMPSYGNPYQINPVFQ
ncbi:hypothetical protein [Aminobacter sp. BE322]|uniref:hypothetical protein n=1 Tax=unclassified Aminobacter TaxID=2644704 RepID=UPI003D223F20